MTTNYGEWIQLLKEAAKIAGFTENGIAHTDWNAFKTYYEDGYSPAEALAEDLSNA